ncbi:SprT-like domain-containing protein [Pseudomonas aeruginosa]
MVDLVRQATDKVRESLCIAERHFSKSFALDDVLFDLGGKAAGQLVYDKMRASYKIRINRGLLQKDPNHVINQTIPHELAHLVAFQVYGAKIAPHGREWQSVMRDVFGLRPDRCHSIDTSSVSPKPFVYTCTCPKLFRLSKRMHTKLATKRRTYKCKHCLGPLVYSHEEKLHVESRVMEHLLVVSKGQPFSAEHAKMLRDLVKGFSVGRVSVRYEGVRGRGIRSLISALKLDESVVSAEIIGKCLPGAVSHAVFFACPGDERSLLAAKKLRERSAVVRVLRHPGYEG